jgi:uncharacterized protein YhfF
MVGGPTYGGLMPIGLYLSPSATKRLKSEGLVTCESKEHLEKIEPGIVQKRMKSIGSVFDVADESGAVQTKAKLIDAFVTTFGNMDMRLVQARGFSSDRARCQKEYRHVWEATFPGKPLGSATELFVAIYEPVHSSPN